MVSSATPQRSRCNAVHTRTMQTCSERHVVVASICRRTAFRQNRRTNTRARSNVVAHPLIAAARKLPKLDTVLATVRAMQQPMMPTLPTKQRHRFVPHRPSARTEYNNLHAKYRATTSGRPPSNPSTPPQQERRCRNTAEGNCGTLPPDCQNGERVEHAAPATTDKTGNQDNPSGPVQPDATGGVGGTRQGQSHTVARYNCGH
jgi:hypothetical protein